MKWNEKIQCCNMWCSVVFSPSTLYVYPVLHIVKQTITRHLQDLVADMAQHSYYSSQCCQGHFGAPLWLLVKKVWNVFIILDPHIIIVIFALSILKRTFWQEYNHLKALLMTELQIWFEKNLYGCVTKSKTSHFWWLTKKSNSFN